MARTVLDNVADTTSTDVTIHKDPTAVWLTAGSANIEMDGNVVEVLDIAEPTRIWGLLPGEVVQIVASGAGTTVKVAP